MRLTPIARALLAASSLVALPLCGCAPAHDEPSASADELRTDSFELWDEDMAPRKVRGSIRVGAVEAGEPYRLYWGNEEAQFVAFAASVPAGVEVPFESAIPADATYLAAYRGADLSTASPSVRIAVADLDSVAVQRDISAGVVSWSDPHIPGVVPQDLAIDAASGSLFVLRGTPTDPRLFRCALDGSACRSTEIAAASTTDPGDYRPYPSSTILVDSARKALIAIDDPGTALRVTRCGLDGKGCTSTKVGHLGRAMSAVLDSAHDKLLIVAIHGLDRAALLFRCEVDGTSCTKTVLSKYVASRPRVAIDEASGKLLVVVEHMKNRSVEEGELTLVRCELDGTACTRSDILAGEPQGSGRAPSMALDTKNGKLLVVTNNASNGNSPSLFRCELDGTACAHTDISAGHRGTGRAPAAVIAGDKLLVVTESQPALFRCNLDGTGCTHSALSSGYDHFIPSVAFDSTTGKLLVATLDRAHDDKPSLFRVTLAK